MRKVAPQAMDPGLTLAWTLIHILFFIFVLPQSPENSAATRELQNGGEKTNIYRAVGEVTSRTRFASYVCVP